MAKAPVTEHGYVGVGVGVGLGVGVGVGVFADSWSALRAESLAGIARLPSDRLRRYENRTATTRTTALES